MLHTWACWQLPGAADGQAVPHIAVVLHGDADGDDTGAVLAGTGHLDAAAAVLSRDTRGRRVRPARLRNVSITVKGSILAPGGNGGYVPCQYGGSGGGGVIRLVAPVVTTAGSLSVNGGTSQDTAASGIARLEYFQGSIDRKSTRLN